MDLYMTDRQLTQLAISTHNTPAAHWTHAHSAKLSFLLDQLERRGWEPRIHSVLSFVRTRITRGGEKT